MKTKLFTKVLMIALTLLLVNGCAIRPYRYNLPTTQYQKHTEVTYGSQGQVIEKKEIIDEGQLNEPIEKYNNYGSNYYGGNYYGGYNGRPHYGRGHSAIRVCLFGCGSSGHYRGGDRDYHHEHNEHHGHHGGWR